MCNLMMFNTIVVQEEAKGILDELDIRTREYEKGYYTADPVEARRLFALKRFSREPRYLI